MDAQAEVERQPNRLAAVVPDFDAIRGWMSREEAECLFQLAMELKEGVILEIGSYQGRSTVALCAGSSLGERKPVFAIEPHEEFVGPHGGRFGAKDRGAFFRNMKRTQQFPLVRLINLTSEIVAPGWQQPIGLAFIDGDHRYPAVRRDFSAWKPFLLTNATVVFDGSTAGGPARVIKERITAGDLEYVKTVGKLGVYKFIGANGPRSALGASALQSYANAKAAARRTPIFEVPETDLTRGVYYGGNGAYLYQPITKCACTTVKTLLIELEGLPPVENEWRRHQKDYNRFPGIENLTPEQRETLCRGGSNTFKFVFVRNPYNRLVSAYADKIRRKLDHWVMQLETWAQAHGYPLGEDITFEDFVRIVSMQDVSQMDPHWRPQIVEGRFDYINFDFIGRFETMESDLTYALERIGAPERIVAKAREKLNATKSNASAWDSVSAETRAMFANKFAADFEILRYPWRLPR